MTSKEEDINRKRAASKIGESNDFKMPLAPPSPPIVVDSRSREKIQPLTEESVQKNDADRKLVIPIVDSIEKFVIGDPKSWTITSIECDALAMACLGDALCWGGFFPHGINKDLPIGLSLLEQSAQLGHPLGLYMLSRAQSNISSCRRHPHEANETEIKAIKAGFFDHNGEGGAVWWHAEAIAYQESRHVSINEKRAIDLIKKCLDVDYTDAWVSYAFCLLHGKGIEKNSNEGIEWLRRAVEMKNGTAMNFLAKCYANGFWVSKDATKALTFYDMAAKEGQDDALNTLGYCSSKGIGCKKDKGKALEYYMKAASLNNPSGMYNVGYYYENGIVCLKDKRAAQFWYAKAVALGHQKAIEGLKRIGKVR